MIRLVVYLLLPILSGPPPVAGYATQFGGGGDGGTALCLGRPVRASDWGVATRGGRCGDLYVLQSKHGTVIVPRIDSGPWQAIPRSCLGSGGFKREVWCRRHEGEALVLLRPHPRWTYGRNAVDATPRVMRALGLKGMGRVRVWRLR